MEFLKLFLIYMQVNAYYDYEDVIDSDEELDLTTMATDPWV